MIEFKDWTKVEMRVGLILEAQRIPKTNKLYKLTVDCGEGQNRTIVTSLVPYYSSDELAGMKGVFVTNLAPVKLGGVASEGMIVCAEKDDESECVLLTLHKDIEVGTKIT